jgi:hypothetical protein
MGDRWPCDDDQPEDIPVPGHVDLAETVRLMTGDIRCQYCHAAPCKPRCRGLDLHPECPHCHNVSGHRSATCPGRYE